MVLFVRRIRLQAHRRRKHTGIGWRFPVVYVSSRFYTSLFLHIYCMISTTMMPETQNSVNFFQIYTGFSQLFSMFTQGMLQCIQMFFLLH
ncbi:hypothetical protein HanRHA438_Chr07g0316751 [Helianthus annuus]|nr:hypothetical protein HanRHA438_Chr07g0316751 [Helianthus annuus]